MARRTDFRKANTYTGQKIKGEVIISYKIDGCRVLYRGGKFVSRNDKAYPGLEKALTYSAKEKIKEFEDCEIFVGSFKETSSILQRHEPTKIITKEHIYPLIDLDKRLFITKAVLPSAEYIESELRKALLKGYEGLVIRSETHWYRVKPTATADVYITGYFEQVDKNKKPKGILGGFTTNWGKVTAFKQEDRELFWKNPSQYIGKLMTVQYKERYNTGKFRYAVKFLHLRKDKEGEAFDTEPPEI